MDWQLGNDKPIFLQLYEQLARRVVTGVYQPGERMPSVRDLASEAGVNPNTMQRALAQLDESGLSEANRTSGRAVTNDLELIGRVRLDLATRAASGYLKEIESLGLSVEEAVGLLREEVKENG